MRQVRASCCDCEEASAAVNLGDGNRREIGCPYLHNLGDDMVGLGEEGSLIHVEDEVRIVAVLFYEVGEEGVEGEEVGDSDCSTPKVVYIFRCHPLQFRAGDDKFFNPVFRGLEILNLFLFISFIFDLLSLNKNK